MSKFRHSTTHLHNSIEKIFPMLRMVPICVSAPKFPSVFPQKWYMNVFSLIVHCALTAVCDLHWNKRVVDNSKMKHINIWKKLETLREKDQKEWIFAAMLHMVCHVCFTLRGFFWGGRGGSNDSYSLAAIFVKTVHAPGLKWQQNGLELYRRAFTQTWILAQWLNYPCRYYLLGIP